MPELIKIDTEDKLRTLLTDVLPYELPLWYTNYCMYKAFKERQLLYELISGLKFSKAGDSLIPLNYAVSRGDNKFRDLSIIHPAAQLRVCDFYHEFSDLIEYYCDKSNQSLSISLHTSFY